jgi:hypothetical protein
MHVPCLSGRWKPPNAALAPGCDSPFRSSTSISRNPAANDGSTDFLSFIAPATTREILFREKPGGSVCETRLQEGQERHRPPAALIATGRAARPSTTDIPHPTCHIPKNVRPNMFQRADHHLSCKPGANCHLLDAATPALASPLAHPPCSLLSCSLAKPPVHAHVGQKCTGIVPSSVAQMLIAHVHVS